MRRLRTGSYLRLLCAAIASCSGTTKAVGDADAGAIQDEASAASVAAYCDAIVAHDAMCANPKPAGYCDRYRVCVQALFLPELLPTLTDCVSSLTCDQDQETACFAPRSATNASATFARFKSSCEARIAACAGQLTGEGFFCFENELGVARDSFIEQLEACLARPCNEIRGCMDGPSYLYQCKG
jgi:hypothetical protein